MAVHSGRGFRTRLESGATLRRGPPDTDSVDGETLTTIADRYPWASWAVWDETFPAEGCVEEHPEELFAFVQDRADSLTPDVVLLGLNRSGDLSAPFANFHSPSGKHFDDRVKEFLQDGDLARLQGAYMTDLVDEVDPDSNNVNMGDADAAVFLDQLRLLGEQEYHVICFGNKPFDALVDYFDIEWTLQEPEIKQATVSADGLTLELYRVWFYGLYGVYQDKVETLQRQLQILDEEIRSRE